MCGDSFSSFHQSDFDGEKQVRVLSVAFRNSQKSAAPPKSGKKKSKSSGSRRGNVGPFRGRPRDSYPEEDDYFEHSHPAPREFLFAWFFVKVSTPVAWSWCFLVFSTALLWRREVVSWMMASPECLDLKSAVGSGVFLPAWEKIIYDAFLLSVVGEGFYFVFVEPLPFGVLRSRSPTMFPFQVHFSAEIVSLLEKGAIEEIRDHPLLCFSPVFVVPKCSGSLRMILLK